MVYGVKSNLNVPKEGVDVKIRIGLAKQNVEHFICIFDER